MAVDLDLAVQRAGQSYQADLRVHVAGSAAPIAPLATPITVAFDLARLRALALDPRAYGAALSAMLFASTELRAAFAQARAVAAQRSVPLRLRLAIAPDADELHALRWEALADPEAPDQVLATSTRLLFSRTLPSPDWQGVPMRTGGALRAAALVASPADLPDYGLAALDAAQEIAQVRAQLSGCALTVLGQELRASLPNLLQQLHRGADLLFMLAHGRADEQGQTWLYLEDDAGHTTPIAGADLVARIGALADKPRLIVLGSCESAGDGSSPVLATLGPQLVRVGVPAVLAMQGRVTVETLGQFLLAFLQALAQDGWIDRAMAVARDLIRDRPDWWMPALWMRATDGRLWAEPARPAAPPNATLHQLRSPIADFVGRQEEIARMTEVLRRAQTEEGQIAAICGVRGMGGIGKTSLAEVVAHQLRPLFPDAQLVIDLRGATAEPLTPGLALQQLVRAFVPEEQLPEDLPALQARYRSLLDGHRALILADDAKDAAQVRPLLPPAGCALLVTSRQRFALDGMASLDLARLDETEAIQLLQSICPRLTDDQAKHLAHLCGGLPLALRISAGILLNDEALPVERYLIQLNDECKRLAQLRDPDDPERDVAATLRLSYAALDEPTKIVLRHLGVLAADADLSLIAAVLEQSDEKAEAVLRLLLRRSLVEYDVAHKRWGLHDLVRVFALEQLAKAGEDQAAWLHYAVQVIHLMAQADMHHQEGEARRVDGLARFDRERPHREAVREWLWTRPSTPKIDALIWDEAFATLHIEDLRDPILAVRVPRWKQATATAKRRGDRYGAGKALANLGHAYSDLGEAHTAIGYFEQWLAIAQEAGDRAGEGWALGNLGIAYRDLGEVRTAISYLEQHLAIAREGGDWRREGWALGNLGIIYNLLGEVRSAIDYYKQDLAIAREGGDRHGEGRTLGNLGYAYAELGETHSAITYYEQALAIAQEMGDCSGEGIVLGNLGNIHRDLGDLDTAGIYEEHYLTISRAVGALRFEGWALNNLAAVQIQRGNKTKILEFGETALYLARQVGDRELEGRCQMTLGAGYAFLNQPTEAATAYQQSLDILDNIGNQGAMACTCWVYGQFLIRQGERERGLALMQECLTYEHRIGHAQATEHAALIAHLQAGGLPPFPTPYTAFAPLRHAIVAVTKGEAQLRAEAEAALAQWECRFYHLTAPVRAIWAGQRDPDALTEGLTVTDAALLRQVLTDLGVDCWGELLEPSAIGATAAA